MILCVPASKHIEKEKSKIDFDNKQIVIQNGIYLSEVMEELFDKVSTVLLNARKQVGLDDKNIKNINLRWLHEFKDGEIKDVREFEEKERERTGINILKVK